MGLWQGRLSWQEMHVEHIYSLHGSQEEEEKEGTRIPKYLPKAYPK
jgi:hypothetical protein